MNKRIVVTLAGGLLFGHSTATFAGLTFTQITTVNGDRSSVTKAWSDGGNAKMEIVESPAENPFMPAGSYMLFKGGDLYLVNPTARTFALFDTSMLQQGMSGMTSQLQFKDISIEKVLDEAGDTIDGYATRHYQFKSSWTMVMTGMPVSTQMNTVEDIWATTAIDVPAAAAAASPAVAASLPPQVAEVAAAQGLRQIEGFPLKHVSVQSTKVDMGGGGAGALGGLGGLGARMAGRMMGGAGANSDTTTTIEVVDLEEIDVPGATFAIPDGYKETQLFQTGPEVPDLNSVNEGPAVPNLNDLDE
jgi:hypothetical protein